MDDPMGRVRVGTWLKEILHQGLIVAVLGVYHHEHVSQDTELNAAHLTRLSQIF